MAQKIVEKEKCTIIPVGMHVEEFTRKPLDDAALTLLSSAYSDHKIEKWQDRFRIVTVGRLEKRKGVEWFLENVLPLLPDNVLYTIIGEGVRRPEVEKWLAENPG